MAARPAGSTPHRELPDQDREVRLECLDRRIERVRHRDVLGARPICIRASSLAAANRLVVGPILPGQRQVVHRALSVGADRGERGEGIEDKVRHPARGFYVPADYGRRRAGMEE
jgi:hypothetical protein